MKNTINKNGFTLIEVIISIAIFSMLILATNLLFISLYRQQGASMAITERTQSMNVLIGRMSKEIREGNVGEKGQSFFAIAEDKTLAFYSDVDNDDVTEKVIYALTGTDLKKTVIEPGADLEYGGTGVTSVVCVDVRNDATPIFTYYDDNYTGSEPALSGSFAVVDIKLIGISLTGNIYSQNQTHTIYIQTKVQVRNS